MDQSRGGQATVDDRRERGAAVALLGLVGAFVVVAALLLGGVTRRIIDRSRAQAAADAAALAGVAEGRSAAQAMANANRAGVIDYDDEGNEVSVRVRTEDGTVAVASAERRLEGFDGG